MGVDRRGFIKGAALGGAAAALGGCATDGLFGASGAPMALFAAPPMERVRIGVIGMGQRGMPAVRTLSGIPGAEVTAMCDLRQEAIDAAGTSIPTCLPFSIARTAGGTCISHGVQLTTKSTSGSSQSAFQPSAPVYALGTLSPRSAKNCVAWSMASCRRSHMAVTSAPGMPDSVRTAGMPR